MFQVDVLFKINSNCFFEKGSGILYNYMKNRAKCKLCNDIIESFHSTDYVECTCGEIIVDGGPAMRCAAKNFDNFLRIDDEGSEIPVKYQELSKFDLADMEPYPEDSDFIEYKATKKEVLKNLNEMIMTYTNLPEHAMSSAITHYDFVSLLLLLSAILRSDCNEDN
jgi:hypothetical protein